MTPDGLVHLGRRNLGVLTLIYVAIATVLLAVPAALAQPRGESPHPITETIRR